MVEPHDVTIHWVGTVASTNAAAREGRFAHGDVVATTEQTAGRGRRGRSWVMNPSEGLALTIVIDVSALGSPTHITRIPLIAATVLADVIADARPVIKWPNDVLIDDAKVAGILVEEFGEGRIGIGMGVNLSGIPRGVEGANPVHLAEVGLVVSPEDLTERVAAGVLEALADIDSPATHALLERALDTIGREVLVELPDGRFVHGLAVGLGESGALLVEAEGFITELVAGDVTHVRHAG